MKQDVCEMRNVCSKKSWVDVCNGNVALQSSVMHTMTQGQDVEEDVDMEEL